MMWEKIKSRGLYFVLEKKKELLWGGCFVLLGALALYRILSFFTPTINKGEQEVEKLYSQWEKTPTTKTFRALEHSLKKYPAQKVRYEGKIVQKALEEKDFAPYLSLALSSLERTEENLSFFSRYAANSLRIAQKDLTPALEEALLLKKDLLNYLSSSKQETPSFSLLFAYNLLRIAFLEKNLANITKEKNAWEEVEKYLGVYQKEPIFPITKEAKNLLLNSFQEGSTTLIDYIAFRKTFLAKTNHSAFKE